MKNSSLLSIVIVFWIFCLYTKSSNAQYFTSRHFTRGADTAEIYLSYQWYIDDHANTWKEIFHSFDNGQSLSVKHRMDLYTQNGRIFGDSLPGALFMIPMVGVDTFGVSYDYGVTFEKKYFNLIGRENAGAQAGELYIVSTDGLYRGIDYGETFTLQSSEDSMLLQEVGTQPGEVYFFKYPYYDYSDTLGLAISSDYGQTYTLKLIKFPGISFFEECTITRGVEAGEIYFIVRLMPDSIALFHSFDYGQTLEFESYILFPNHEIWYTGGRTPGSFYYADRDLCGYFDHSCIWIHFSRDYGKTFTTYFHELDSTFTGIPEPLPLEGTFSVYPNPTTDILTVEFKGVSENCDVELLDPMGRLIIKKPRLPGERLTKIPVGHLPASIYILRVRSGDSVLGLEKVAVKR